MKKLLLIGLVNFGMIVNSNSLRAEGFNYWGKDETELCSEKPELKAALWDAYWDTRYIKFFSLFTSHFPEHRIIRMKKSVRVIHSAISGIEQSLNSYYNRKSDSRGLTDNNNMGGTFAAHIAAAPYLLLSILLGNSSSEKIRRMKQAKEKFIEVQNRLIEALKICKEDLFLRELL